MRNRIEIQSSRSIQLIRQDIILHRNSCTTNRQNQHDRLLPLVRGRVAAAGDLHVHVPAAPAAGLYQPERRRVQRHVRAVCGGRRAAESSGVCDVRGDGVRDTAVQVAGLLELDSGW